MTVEDQATAPPPRFCTACGGRLPAGARFCPACGRTLDAPPSPAQAPARTLRDQLPGLGVLTLFLAVGLALWVTVLEPGAPTSSAPRRPGPPAEGAGVPPDHPPLALPDEARAFIEQLTAKAEAAPTDAGAWKNLAQVQARAAEIDPSYGPRALASYRHLVGLAPDDLEAIRGLGNAYYDQRQYAEAAEQYGRYLTIAPDDPNVRTDLGTAYLYQRQIDRALETYAQVIEARPDFLQAHFNLGLAYEAKGEREKALASLTTARTLAKDDATRSRIDRVVAQITGEPAGADGPARKSGTAGAQGREAEGATGTAAADFRGELEAGLRGHEVLGPKITAIEWPDDARARVRVANFPVQSMPEPARDLFRTRLETLLGEAKSRHGVTDSRTIELVDAGTGASLATVTR